MNRKPAVPKPSFRDLEPLEEGGRVSRLGLEFQDHIAARGCLLMFLDTGPAEVWCEAEDDIVFVWSDGTAEWFEFVQVKSTDLRQAWTVPKLCDRDSTRDASGKNTLRRSIVEKSLSHDRALEPCRFRLVTCWEPDSVLSVLKLAIGTSARTKSRAKLAEAVRAIGAKLRGYASPNGNGPEFWVANTCWEVWANIDAVQSSNSLDLEQILIAAGFLLLPDQRRELYERLLRRVRDASLASDRTQQEAKRLTRAAFRAWLLAQAKGMQHEGGAHVAGLRTDLAPGANASPNRPSITLGVSVIEKQSDQGESLGYRARRVNGRLVIEPSMDYLTHIERDQRVRGIGYDDHRFEGHPQLDLKLLNNTDATHFVQRIVLCVEESRVDLRPLLVARWLSHGASIVLMNQGWSDLIDPVLDYVVQSGQQLIPPDRGLTHRASLRRTRYRPGPFPAPTEPQAPVYADEGHNIVTVYWSGLLVAPLSSEALEPLGKVSHAYVFGNLSYRWDDHGVTRDGVFRFFTYVYLYTAAAAGLVLPSARYETTLRSGVVPQEVPVEASQAVKAGDPDRFTLEVKSDRSAFYGLRVKLVMLDGTEVISEPFSLHCIVPYDPY